MTGHMNYCHNVLLLPVGNDAYFLEDCCVARRRQTENIVSNDKLVPTAYRSAGFGCSAVVIDRQGPNKTVRAARPSPLTAVHPTNLIATPPLVQAAVSMEQPGSVAA